MIDRVECDISYLENWSLRMDPEISLKTAIQVLRPRRRRSERLPFCVGAPL